MSHHPIGASATIFMIYCEYRNDEKSKKKLPLSSDYLDSEEALQAFINSTSIPAENIELSRVLDEMNEDFKPTEEIIEESVNPEIARNRLTSLIHFNHYQCFTFK